MMSRILVMAALPLALLSAGGVSAFDHDYRLSADVLARHVRGPRVDYASLKAVAPRGRAVAVRRP